MTGVMWNVNGMGEMGEYITELVKKIDPDVMLLTETKRRQKIEISIDLAIDPRVYRQRNSIKQHSTPPWMVGSGIKKRIESGNSRAGPSGGGRRINPGSGSGGQGRP